MNLILSALLLAQSMFSGLPIDGIQCNSTEGVAEHIHSHLLLYDRGKPVPVPADVGIPVGAGCLYWLHTHASDGVIHIETPVKRNFTLGEFFDIWGAPLTRTHAAGLTALHGSTLRFSVNGKAWTGDPRAIPLRDAESIVIRS